MTPPQFLGIIPARYASSRFPGKPLALLGDKPMIRWVYETASRVFPHLVVATDDRRIMAVVESFGGRALMTSANHPSGTDRCAEALHQYRDATGLSFSHVVNIQGDEPFIREEQLTLLAECIADSGSDIATLIRSLDRQADLESPHVVKVVVDKNFRALYFSRAPIPYARSGAVNNLRIPRYAHLGLYGYRTGVLEEVVRLGPSALELSESLEQLRWLEHGYAIQTAVTPYHSRGVDTPEDLEALQAEI